MSTNHIRSVFWLLPHEVRRVLFRAVHPGEFSKLNTRKEKLSIFQRHKCLFVHIPKCAGMSISRSLFNTNLVGDHLTIKQYQLLFSRDQIDNYFKFAFVRNPWDRLVSAYFFLQQGGYNARDRQWAKKHLDNFATFDSFVRGYTSIQNTQTWIHFRPQHHFVCGAGGKLGVDFIGRFENLEQDFQHIAQVIGINAPLLHVNKTTGPRKDYRNYYTPETRRIVRNIYQRDISLFSYTFDD